MAINAWYRAYRTATRALLQSKLKDREVGILKGFKMLMGKDGNDILEFPSAYYKDTKTFSSFSEAISNIGASVTTLLVSNEVDITSNISTPPNISVVRVEAGRFTSSNASQLTINGPFSSPLSQAFYGNLAVAFGSGSAIERFPQWWGVKGDGVTNDASPFQRALNAGGKIRVPDGTYVIGSSLNAVANTTLTMVADATLALGSTARIIVGDSFTGDKFSIAGGRITKASATKGTFSSNNSLVSIGKTSGAITEITFRGVTFESDIDSGTINKFGAAVLSRFVVENCVFTASSAYHRNTDIYLNKPDDTTDTSTGRTVAVEINNNKFFDSGREHACVISRGNSKTGYVNISGNSFTRMIYGAVQLGDNSPTSDNLAHNAAIAGNSILDSGISATNPTDKTYGILVYGVNVQITGNLFNEFNRYDSAGVLQGVNGYCWCIYVKARNTVIANNVLKNSGYTCVLQLKGDTGDDPGSPEGLSNILSGNVITLDSTFLSSQHGVSGSEDPAVIKVRVKGGIITNNVVIGDATNKPFRGMFITAKDLERTVIQGNYLENITNAFTGTSLVTGNVTRAENNIFVNCNNKFNGASPSWKKSFDPVLKNNPYIQTFFYVNPSGGDDGANGYTPELALATIAEALRRIPDLDDNQTTYTIYLLGNSLEDIYVPNNCIGGKIIIQGYIGETVANTEVGSVQVGDFSLCTVEFRNLILKSVTSGNCFKFDGVGRSIITNCVINTSGTVTYHVVARHGHVLNITGLSIAASVAAGTSYGIASQYGAKVYLDALSGSVSSGTYGLAATLGGTLHNADDSNFTGFTKAIHVATSGKYFPSGTGGAVTQATDKSTGVTLSRITGQITMNAANLVAGTAVSFTLTNTMIEATDTMVINHVAGGTLGGYSFQPRCAAGSATISVRNLTSGDLAEALVLQFNLIKGAIS